MKLISTRQESIPPSRVFHQIKRSLCTLCSLGLKNQPNQSIITLNCTENLRPSPPFYSIQRTTIPNNKDNSIILTGITLAGTRKWKVEKSKIFWQNIPIYSLIDSLSLFTCPDILCRVGGRAFFRLFPREAPTAPDGRAEWQLIKSLFNCRMHW